MEGSKFTTKGARVIAAQLYVAKGLKRNPSKMIKFIKVNKEYFPNISYDMLVEMQKEHNLTDEDIDKETNLEFADLQAERKFEEELLNKAKKIDEKRKHETRDHRGKGNATIYKSRQESEPEQASEQESEQESEQASELVKKFKKMMEKEAKVMEMN